MKKAKEKRKITVIEYLGLLPGEKTKWVPVYSYIRQGGEFVHHELLHYEPYVNMPRREAE